MPLPVSLLKQVIDSLPEDFITKRESVVSLLKKKGVKDEELKASGVGDSIATSASARLRKADLQSAVAARKDNIRSSVIDDISAPYSDTTLAGSNLETYKVNLRRFNFDPKRNAKTHFNAEGFDDVLWHTRTTDETIGGHSTRLVQELQSDLHQQARRFGSTVEEAEVKRNVIADEVKELTAETSSLDDKIVDLTIKMKAAKSPMKSILGADIAELVGRQQDIRLRVGTLNNEGKALLRRESLERTKKSKLEDEAFDEETDLVDNIINLKEDISHIDEQLSKTDTFKLREERANTLDTLNDFNRDLDKLKLTADAEVTSPFPPTPFSKNWLRKAMEQEVLDAVEDGKSAIAVPLERAELDLGRDGGTQKFYETQVRGTLKKLAKTLGGEYREVSEGGISVSESVLAEVEEMRLKMTPNDREGAVDILETIEQILGNNGYRMFADPVIQEADRISSPPELVSLALEQARKKTLGVTTGQIVFPQGDAILKELAEAKVPTNPPTTLDEAADRLEGSLALFDQVQDALISKNLAVSPENVQKEVLDNYSKYVNAEGGKKMTEQLKLYSTAGAGIGIAAAATPEGVEAAEIDLSQVNEAFAQEFKVSEISDFLLEQGNDVSSIQTALNSALAERITAAREADIPDEDINAFLTDDLGVGTEEASRLMIDTEAEFTPTGVPGEGDFPISEEIVKNIPEYSPTVLADMYRSMGQRYAADARSIAGTWSKEYAQKAKEDSFKLSNMIVKGMERHGMDVSVQPDESGQFNVVWNSPDGPQTLDSEFWNQIGNSEYEITGAIAIATGAVRLGAALPGWGKFLSALAGGALGASTGKAADLARLASATDELDNIKAAQYIDVMVDAGVAELTFGVLGTTVFKAGSATVKFVGKAFDTFARGNRDGAYSALKTHLGVDDAQVDEIIKNWEGITESKLGGSRASKALRVLPQVTPGGEAITAKAAQINPKVGSALIQSISNRAKNVAQAANDITNDNVGVIIKDDLASYTDEVKNFYGGIKNHAVDAMEDSGYTFDYDKLTIDPLFEAIGNKINNTAVKEQFLNRLNSVRQLGAITDLKGEPIAASGLRGFDNLLELRKIVNEFKFNKRIVRGDDIKTINDISSRLDREIASAVSNNMPQGDVWLKEWKKANIEYSKMLTLKDNVMFKALTAKGVNMDKIISTVVKDIKSIDGTFMQVMGKLPQRTRTLAEGAILKKLISNHTIGDAGGFNAIHFPNLERDLDKLGFTDPTARGLKRAVKELANVFKNDVGLARAGGEIHTEKFTNTLSTDPKARIHMMVITKMFHAIQKYMPTEKGRAAAMMVKASKLLKDPANSKNIQSIIKDLPDDPELKTDIKRLAIEYAKFGYKEAYPKVKVYRTGVPGRTHKPLKGKLGEGIYWTTSKEVAKERSKATGGKVISDKILPARIADESNVRDILGADINILDLRNNPAAIEKLKDKGFTGLALGEDMVIFK